MMSRKMAKITCMVIAGIMLASVLISVAVLFVS